MDAKKKLVELANDVLQYLPWGEIQKDTAEQIADRMIDHGVTVQGDELPTNCKQLWIPVTERLPEPFVSVLAYVPSEAPLLLVHESYMADDVLWVCILERRLWKYGAVTHWMPMPEPPEE